MRDFAIYTVCTGHYKYGLFALLKSLHKNGYDGPVVVATNAVIGEITHLKNVEQVILDSPHVFGNLKGRIILEKPSRTFLYLDPDIIVLDPSFIPTIRKIISGERKQLVVTAEGIVARNEVRRWMWNKAMQVDAIPQTDFYYSGGLLGGIFEHHKQIIEEWDRQIHKHIEPGKYFQACPEFPLADQDILNAVLQNMAPEMICTLAIPDWLGTATGINPFHPCGQFEKPLMVHATGKLKTWTLKELPKRYPNTYDRAFYQYHIDNALHIKSDLTFTWLQRKWLQGSRILPFYNKLRTIF